MEMRKISKSDGLNNGVMLRFPTGNSVTVRVRLHYVLGVFIVQTLSFMHCTYNFICGLSDVIIKTSSQSVIYINDLINHLEKIGVRLKLFADDVKVYVEIVDPSDVHQLQRAIDCLVEWAETWQLPISINNCCAMHIVFCAALVA